MGLSGTQRAWAAYHIRITRHDSAGLQRRVRAPFWSPEWPPNKGLREILLPLRKDNGYCFVDEKGKQFNASKLSAEFKKLVAKPTAILHFSLHTLRHTFASHLVMKGISIYKVSQWLGHRSVNTTMIYAHLSPQDDEIDAL